MEASDFPHCCIIDFNLDIKHICVSKMCNVNLYNVNFPHENFFDFEELPTSHIHRY